MIKLIDILNENYPPYKADMVSKIRYKASDVWTNDQKLAIKKGYSEDKIKQMQSNLYKYWKENFTMESIFKKIIERI